MNAHSTVHTRPDAAGLRRAAQQAVGVRCRERARAVQLRAAAQAVPQLQLAGCCAPPLRAPRAAVALQRRSALRTLRATSRRRFASHSRAVAPEAPHLTPRAIAAALLRRARRAMRPPASARRTWRWSSRCAARVPLPLPPCAPAADHMCFCPPPAPPWRSPRLVASRRWTTRCCLAKCSRTTCCGCARACAQPGLRQARWGGCGARG
jgi:hypothetical protein